MTKPQKQNVCQLCNAKDVTLIAIKQPGKEWAPPVFQACMGAATKLIGGKESATVTVRP